MPDLTVVYESGVLRPTTPIDFEEGQQLQIRILEPETPSLTLEQALQPLIRRGSLTMPPRDRATSLPEIPLTSPAITTPISDIIIEDRGPL